MRHAFLKVEMKGNVRLQIGHDKNGSPYAFRLEDYELIEKSKNLFARKFSESVDKDLICKVLHLKDRKR